MKRPIVLSLSVLLSSTLVANVPVYAHSTNVYAEDVTDVDLPLTSRSEYGIIYNNKYPESTDKLVKEYISKNEALYQSEGLSNSFAYFNVDNYLNKYADVKESLLMQIEAEGLNQDTSELNNRALSYYLQYGMPAGQISGTNFDPVIALMAYPELYQGENVDLSADAVKKAFQEALHVEDTTEFRITFYYVGNQKMLIVERLNKNSTNTGSNYFFTNYTNKTTTNKTSDEEESEFELPDKINNLAEDITPYRLYSLTGDAEELGLSGTATTNYDLIKDKLTSQYTMMVYLCGTDLEDKDKTLSSSIAQMLQSKPTNMNIVLLIGGTDQYGNTYLNNSIGKEKTGVYYLDTSKTYDDSVWQDVYNNDHYDAVLNEDTLINLATFDTANIGDPSLLSGFMNLSTDLFEADAYSLIVWNHGGGVINGICSPDTQYVAGDELAVNELESAFRASDLIKKGKKLDVLAFDACLMGSSEIAYNLHNYYDYMFGSEDLEMGDFEYIDMLPEMNTLLENQKATSYNMVKVIFDHFSYYTSATDKGHIGASYIQQTGGVYDSQATEELITSLDNMAKKLNTAIKLSPNNGEELLNTISQARMKCETMYYSNTDTWNDLEPQYVDIGEIASFLKENLINLKEKVTSNDGNEDYISSLTDTIDAIKELQKHGNLVMSSTWYNGNQLRKYAGEEAISIEDLATKSPISKLWSQTQGTTASYGTTIYFPLVVNPKDENLSKYNSFYEGTNLDNYNTLINTIINWKKSETFQTQLTNLKKELKNSKIYQSSSIQNYEDAKSKQYLVIKFKTEYDENSAPEDSFGNPLYDTMISMSANPKVYAAYDYTFKDKEENDIKSCKKVVLVNEVSAEHFDLEDSTLNVQLNSLTGYALYQKGTTKEGELDQKLTESYGEEYTSKMLQALFGENSGLDTSKMKVVRGIYSTSENKNVDSYHIFYLDETNDNNYLYKGTEQMVEDKVFNVISDIETVSFYDYFLNQTDSSGNETITSVECSGDYNFGESKPAYIEYKVDDDNPIYLKKFTFDLSSEKTENFDPNDFEYAVSVDISYTNEEGKTEIATNITPGVCTTESEWQETSATE